MKKVLLFVVAALMLVLGACSESDVKTGGTPNSTEKKTTTTETKPAPKVDNSKTIDASKQVVNVVGMQVGLGQIKISEDKIEVGVNLANTTNQKLTFYPDQGHLVVGDMQLDSNMFMEQGKIGGEVEGGVKQQAVLVFPAPDGKKIDMKSVTSIKLTFGDVITADYMTNKPVEFTVPVQ